jgi:hypothetical protein
VAVDRRGQAGAAGHVAAPASLLALAAWQPGHGAMQARCHMHCLAHDISDGCAAPSRHSSEFG